jgi:hypothetical protein
MSDQTANYTVQQRMHLKEPATTVGLSGQTVVYYAWRNGKWYQTAATNGTVVSLFWPNVL